MVIIIIIAVLLILTLFLRHNLSWCVQRFKNGNTLVYGKKRQGKDLFFQNIIRARKEPYFSNFSYGGKWNKIELSELSVEPNTYDDLINGTITKVDKNHKLEGKDIYIQDGGNYLPSQYHDKLIKRYPSMPIFYSVQGHLYNNRTHVNYNGSYTRLWDKLREQADEFFFVLGSVNLIIGRLTRVRYYELEESAKQRLPKFSKHFIEGGNVKAQRLSYNALHGQIKEMWVYLPKRNIKYDHRAFQTIFFNQEQSEETNVKP